MKLSCTQTDFNAHLSIVSRVVPSRPSHPILANILVVADADRQQIRLTAFDLSLGISTAFAAQIESEGILTLPCKLLCDIISRLPDGEIMLESTGADTLVSLSSASGNYQVRGMASEGFPELPMLDEGVVAHLPVNALIEGLRGTLFSTSMDETKQVLTGVHISTPSEGLEFAATDGHRLAIIETIAPDTADSQSLDLLKFNVTVPAKALRELDRMLQLNSNDTVAVRYDPGQLVFEWANQRLTTRLLEGQYPNYQQLIPRQFLRQITLDRRAFLSSLERIAVLADQRNSVVVLSFSPITQELVLSVDAQDIGNGREAIAAQVSGEAIEIAFNVKYLIECLKAMNTQEAQIQCNSPTSPAIFSPVGGTKGTFLIMPVQVRAITPISP